MKSQFWKISTLLLILVTVILFTLASRGNAEKHEPKTLQSQIAGSWEIASYLVDSFEYVGYFVDSSFIQFEAYTGNEGVCQHVWLYSNGNQGSLDGKYRVDETKMELAMTFLDETEILKISFPDEETMIWEGEEDGLPLKTKALRH